MSNGVTAPVLPERKSKAGMSSTRAKAWLAWSSGKDAAWALHEALRSQEVEVVGLLTTMTEPYDRASMHGVRAELVEAQAGSLGLTLHKAFIPAPCSDEEYAAVMRACLAKARAEGVTSVVFGDVFLAGVREYREKELGQVGMTAVFPLWEKRTETLARDMLCGGLRARVTCLDPRKVPRELAGREFDGRLLAELPPGVDPCGENGEFHTFCTFAPGFDRPVDVEPGVTVERGGFVFTDLTPRDSGIEAP